MIFPSKRLNTSIWPIAGTLTGTITLGQSGPKSNGDEEVATHSPRQGSHHEIQFNVAPRTQNDFKHCYLILIVQFNVNHTVKWFQEL